MAEIEISEGQINYCYFCKGNTPNLKIHESCIHDFKQEIDTLRDTLNTESRQLAKDKRQFSRITKELEDFNYFRSTGFLESFNEVLKHFYNYDRFEIDVHNVFSEMKSFILKKKDKLTKTEENFKVILEELKRFLYVLYYISDSLEGTHAERNKVKHTLNRIIAKQISFFDQMNTDYYIRGYFDSFHYQTNGNSLLTFYDLQTKNQSLSNDIKKLQQEIQFYKNKEQET